MAGGLSGERIVSRRLKKESFHSQKTTSCLPAPGPLLEVAPRPVCFVVVLSFLRKTNQKNPEPLYAGPARPQLLGLFDCPLAMGKRHFGGGGGIFSDQNTQIIERGVIVKIL